MKIKDKEYWKNQNRIETLKDTTTYIIFQFEWKEYGKTLRINRHLMTKLDYIKNSKTNPLPPPLIIAKGYLIKKHLSEKEIKSLRNRYKYTPLSVFPSSTKDITNHITT